MIFPEGQSQIRSFPVLEDLVNIPAGESLFRDMTAPILCLGPHRFHGQKLLCKTAKIIHGRTLFRLNIRETTNM